MNITRIAIDPPSAKPDRTGIALVAIMRNEGRYAAEWAAFHASAGVRHFYVYDNGSTDDTVVELERALRPDQLTVIPWDQKLCFAR